MFRQIIVCLLILAALVACTQTSDLSYDTQPSTIILYADIHGHGGPPQPGDTCLTYPRLRIWGDGFVLLSIATYGSTEPPLWSGKLTANQVNDILDSLQQQGFFNQTSHSDGPNTACTSLYLWANLKSQSVHYESGNLAPNLYNALLGKIKPSLTPFTLDKIPDARIRTLDCLPSE
jgi:hypothetical protein